MTRATLGFVFSPDFSQVLLIRKRRPAWQMGKINGVGGKCEDNESFVDCISREVAEETGMIIAPNEWKQIATLKWEKWHVQVYASIWSHSFKDAQSLTDEEVEWFMVTALPANCMSNLRWLIPLGCDSLQTPELTAIDVHYS